MRIDQHHWDQCQVVHDGHGRDHQDLSCQPVTALNWCRENALYKAVHAWTSKEHCRDWNKSKWHKEIGNDPVSVQPGVLRAHGGNATDTKQNDAGTEPSETASHHRLKFLDVESCNRHVLGRVLILLVKPRLRSPTAVSSLFFMVEWLTVRPNLNFGLLAVANDFGFISNESAFLGERFDLDDFSIPGLALQTVTHCRSQRFKRNRFLDLNYGTAPIHQYVLGVTVHHQFGLIKRLPFLLFLRETPYCGPFALFDNGLFNRRG